MNDDAVAPFLKLREQKEWDISLLSNQGITRLCSGNSMNIKPKGSTPIKAVFTFKGDVILKCYFKQ